MSLTTLRLSTLLLAIISLQVITSTFAFELLYPSADEGTYWVTNDTNTLAWSMGAEDAPFFSVELLAGNSSALAGNFQIANALPSVNETYKVVLDLIPAGTYTMLFVNSNNYSLDHPEVYYTSPSFQIKPNGTTPAQYTPSLTIDSTASTTINPAVSSIVPSPVVGVTGISKDNKANGGFTLSPASFGCILSLALVLSTVSTLF